MLETLLVSFKLKITYLANEVIYSLKQLPIIGKTISDKCYSDKTIKILAFIISIIKTIFWDILLKKLLYVFVMFAFILAGIQSITNNTDIGPFETSIPIITTFIFLTIVGGLINNDMFETSQDKYYAIFTLRINAKKYLILNYISNLLKTTIGIFIALFVFRVDKELSILTLFFMSVFVACVKIICTWINIIEFKKTGTIKLSKKRNIMNIIIVFIFIILAYVLPLIGLNINEQIFWIIFALSFILAIEGMRQIYKFNDYKIIYKKSDEESQEFNAQTKNTSQLRKEQALSQIEMEEKFISKKTGYAFFNELFMKRHKKIVGKAIKLETIILLVIVLIVIGFTVIARIPGMDADISAINNSLLNSLPYFTLIMFWLNRSTVITQSMYMNCDHSMLTYKFYKTSKAILGLFKERLKTLILINLIPSGIIAISLPIILFLSGGTDNPLNYLVLFISIISMSIFFSTHYLVIYYLLQPYTKESELKGSSYKIVQTITIIACYNLSNLKMDTSVFGLAMIIFCITYLVISMILVYKYAPKTFKIRG